MFVKSEVGRGVRRWSSVKQAGTRIPQPITLRPFEGSSRPGELEGLASRSWMDINFIRNGEKSCK
jgi:hypothetical protein